MSGWRQRYPLIVFWDDIGWWLFYRYDVVVMYE